jgi:hypothetical protein
MTYVTSVGPVTPKPGGFRALDVETCLRAYLLKSKELRSLTSHTIFFLRISHLLTRTLIAWAGKRSGYSMKNSIYYDFDFFDFFFFFY